MSAVARWIAKLIKGSFSKRRSAQQELVVRDQRRARRMVADDEAPKAESGIPKSTELAMPTLRLKRLLEQIHR